VCQSGLALTKELKVLRKCEAVYMATDPVHKQVIYVICPIDYILSELEMSSF